MLQKRLPVATFIACVFGRHLKCVVLSASKIKHILKDAGQTCKAYASYAGRAFSLVCAKRRGIILQEELARLHPHSTIEEPTRGARCNGAQRSASQAEWDFR